MTELVVDPRAAGLFIIRVCGPLDRLAAARLLRLVETERAVIVRSAAGHRPALILDLSLADLNPQGALTALRHARHSCRRAGVALCLVVGDEGSAVDGQPRTRHLSNEFTRVDSLDDAIAAVTPGRTEDRAPAEETRPPRVADPTGGTLRLVPTTLRRLGRYDW